MSQPQVLHIENLNVTFKGQNGVHKAIDNICLSLNAGETLGIVGESGSGKSITSLSVMQLLPGKRVCSCSGLINFSGKGELRNLLEQPKKVLQKIRGRQIAMIFQEPMTSLNPSMRCGEQVAEALRHHLGFTKKQAKAKTLELFQEVQLPRAESLLSAWPHQLSGGQKQRVMIAMAIACNPEILIADEPTTALDVTIQKTIIELLMSLQKKYGMSIIFITHDLGVIRQIAGKVVVMYKGTIVESGLTEQILNAPNHPYTKGLLACRPPLNVRLKRLPTVADFMENAAADNSAFVDSLKMSEADFRDQQKKIYTQPPLLEIENLECRFPSKRNFLGKPIEYVNAVDKVSFVVYPGETLGLVGESGCGKTTLGRSILRMTQHTTGVIKYKGKVVSSLTMHGFTPYRKQMQIIFQDPFSSLNPRLTIGSAICEPMKVHRLYGSSRQQREKAISLLNRVGLGEEHFNRYPHEFSGGQRQRICIARTLAVNPEFIICDESVSALDVSVQAQVLNLLNELKQEFGFTYLFISHDLSVVRYMSDRILVMKNGKIVESGDADEIFHSPKHPYTRNLISAIPG